MKTKEELTFKDDFGSEMYVKNFSNSGDMGFRFFGKFNCDCGKTEFFREVGTFYLKKRYTKKLINLLKEKA